MLQAGHSRPGRALAVLLGGLLASTSTDKEMLLWDTGAKTCVRRMQGHSGRITSLVVFASRSAGLWVPRQGGQAVGYGKVFLLSLAVCSRVPVPAACAFRRLTRTPKCTPSMSSTTASCCLAEATRRGHGGNKSSPGLTVMRRRLCMVVWGRRRPRRQRLVSQECHTCRHGLVNTVTSVPRASRGGQQGGAGRYRLCSGALGCSLRSCGASSAGGRSGHEAP